MTKIFSYRKMKFIPNSTIALMLKPDVRTMPELESLIAHDLLLSFYDILSGQLRSDLYKSKSVLGLAISTAGKIGVPKTPTEQIRREILAELFLLHKKYPPNDQIYVLRDFILDVIKATGFEITYRVQFKLTGYWIKRLYPALNSTSFSKGELWKEELLEVLQEEDVEFFVLEGVLGSDFTNAFKDMLRYSLRSWHDRGQNVVRNILHIPEPSEMEMALEMIRDIRVWEHK